MKLKLSEIDQNFLKKKSPESNPGLFQGSILSAVLGGIIYKFSNFC